MQIIIENWPRVLELLAAIVTLLSIVNGFLPHGNSVLRKIIDALSFITNKDSPKSIKAPLKRSKPPVRL